MHQIGHGIIVSCKARAIRSLQKQQILYLLQLYRIYIKKSNEKWVTVNQPSCLRYTSHVRVRATSGAFSAGEG